MQKFISILFVLTKSTTLMYAYMRTFIMIIHLYIHRHSCFKILNAAHKNARFMVIMAASNTFGL